MKTRYSPKFTVFQRNQETRELSDIIDNLLFRLSNAREEDQPQIKRLLTKRANEYRTLKGEYYRKQYKWKIYINIKESV